MAFFTGKNDFASGNQVTHTLLNNITDNLRLASDSVSSTFSLNTGTLSIAGSGIVTSLIADSNVTTAKIADNAITTAKLPDSTSSSDGVTFAKMQFVSATSKVLGRKSASSGVIEELEIDTDLTSLSSSDDTVASAKAIGTMYGSVNTITPATLASDTDYVRLPNGLIIKMGAVSRTGTETTITYDTTRAFTTVYSLQITGLDADASAGTDLAPVIKTSSTTNAVVVTGSAVTSIHYLAIGR